MRASVARARALRGTVHVPGDKSICHRALLLGAIAEGRTVVDGFVPSADCLSSLRCIEALGAAAERVGGERVVIEGRGWRGLHEAADVLDAGNSGTTTRLLAGILAGQPFYSVLTGDASLRRRPMQRVAEPLRRMGATVLGRDGGRLLPLTIKGGDLQGIDHTLPVASAQVKSAILFAGLCATGRTVVREPAVSRDHSERMLRAMGVAVERVGPAVAVTGGARPQGIAVAVPGDISSAAFCMVAAAIVPEGEVVVSGVGINPTRTGILDALRAMGADVSVENEREVGGEPIADVRVRSSALRGTAIEGSLVPRLIDELPVLAVAATQATGRTVVRDAAELRVKESDRVATIVGELSRLGAQIEERPDGFVIEGPTPLRGALVESHGDHRIAMALAVAGLVAAGETAIEGAEAIEVSFPGFFAMLESLRR